MSSKGTKITWFGTYIVAPLAIVVMMLGAALYLDENRWGWGIFYLAATALWIVFFFWYRQLLDMSRQIDKADEIERLYREYYDEGRL